jgi:hypothetical protein
VSVTSDSKGMSILRVLMELTHLFGILQVLSGLTAVVATVDSMVGTSSSGPRGVEPLPKKAHISALLVCVWSLPCLAWIFAPPIFIPELKM